MLQILVDRRETLDLGEIVPVGDLFDAITEGDEPFTESTRHHFENARNLYSRKLLPLIESLHGIAKAEAETRPKNDKAARALRAEDRLAKTLLLSALAPEVEVMENPTATRLAALNHGSIRTPIEGREGPQAQRGRTGSRRAWKTPRCHPAITPMVGWRRRSASPRPPRGCSNRSGPAGATRRTLATHRRVCNDTCSHASAFRSPAPTCLRSSRPSGMARKLRLCERGDPSRIPWRDRRDHEMPEHRGSPDALYGPIATRPTNPQVR